MKLAQKNKITLNYDVLDKFQILIVKLKELQEKQILQDEIYGDAPEDFLDPLTYTFMENPQYLPTGQVIDYHTIKTHLLTDQTDPFTMQPLKLEDLKPATDLKEKIDAWKEEKMGEYKKNK